MMGPKGYMVTFRQTDPLFTFDLSDPQNPRMLGELKINGFSSYMHPMGENHLLTIGQDADDEGRVQGVHLQIFDVSNMAKPVRTFQEKVSTGSWSSQSEALQDHHAFTYHDEKEILAFPINIYGQSMNEHFTGLLIYKASKTKGFEKIGQVGHGDVVKQVWCEKTTTTTDCVPGPDYQWWTQMRRSLFIEDFVYSLSDVALKVNKLLNPSTQLASVDLH
jgi:hypothetical protein